MRNIFDQYEQDENKLTHSLASCLYEDKRLLNSFLKNFCSNFFNQTSNLKIEQQTVPGERHLIDDESQRKGLPDAVIYTEEQCLIIESKVSSTLTRDQLMRHERTVRRRGFNNIRGIGIVVDLLPKVRLDNWEQLTWKQVYSWAYKETNKSNKETNKSKWARKLIDYFNVWENKYMVGKLEGSITEFTGVHFDDENPYSYLEGKRQLRLLVNKIKQNKILQEELNVDLSKEGRGAMKGGTWDILRFKSGVEVMSFTDELYLTIGLGETGINGLLTVPYKMKGITRKNFYNLSWDDFKKIIYKIAQNYRNYFPNSKGFQPCIRIQQLRYPSQSSTPITDGQMNLDIRTAFEDLSSELKPTQKKQEEWLRAVFELNNNKKSNIQFQVGADFFYNKHTLVNNKDADQVVCKSFLACKPLIDYLFS